MHLKMKEIHSLSVIISKGSELNTMTAVAPESKWSTDSQKLTIVAESFELINKQYFFQ